MLLALPSAAGTAASIAPRLVPLPIRDLVLPVTVTGTLTSEPSGEKTFVSGRIEADLREAQRRSPAVLRALLDRDAACGERIVVDDGSLAARAPALRVRASIAYQRTTCLGERVIPVVPRTRLDVDVLLHPVVAPRSLTFRAEILDVRAGPDPLPAALSRVIRGTLEAEIARRIGNLFPAVAPPDAVLGGVVFDQTKAGRLLARLDGSATLPRAAVADLMRTR